jgi:hypothetical protein
VSCIEGVLNDRPLLSITGEKPEDCTVLTPASFIAPNVRLGIPPQDKELEEDPDYLPNTKVADDLKSLYMKNVRKLDSLWKTWNTSYLQELRAAQTHYFKMNRGEVPRESSLGEVVLIKEATPRSTWKMGKIIKLYQGEDDKVRFVGLRAPGDTYLKRGVRDIIPLELDLERESVKAKETHIE